MRSGSRTAQSGDTGNTPTTAAVRLARRWGVRVQPGRTTRCSGMVLVRGRPLGSVGMKGARVAGLGDWEGRMTLARDGGALLAIITTDTTSNANPVTASSQRECPLPRRVRGETADAGRDPARACVEGGCAVRIMAPGAGGGATTLPGWDRRANGATTRTRNAVTPTTPDTTGTGMLLRRRTMCISEYIRYQGLHGISIETIFDQAIGELPAFLRVVGAGDAVRASPPGRHRRRGAGRAGRRREQDVRRTDSGHSRGRQATEVPLAGPALWRSWGVGALGGQQRVVATEQARYRDTARTGVLASRGLAWW